MAKVGPEDVSTPSPVPLTVAASESPIFLPLKKCPSQSTPYKQKDLRVPPPPPPPPPHFFCLWTAQGR